MKDKSTPIPTTSIGFGVRAATAAVLVLLLSLAVSVLLSVLYTSTPQATRLLFIIVWVVFPFLWLVGVLVGWKRKSGESYSIEPNALQVASRGVMKTRSQLYRFDSILSIETRQGFFGKKYGYGTIVVSIPRNEKNLYLKDVISPDKFAALLKSNTTAQSTTKSLVI